MRFSRGQRPGRGEGVFILNMLQECARYSGDKGTPQMQRFV